METAEGQVGLVLVEDDPVDAELTLHALMRAGVSRHVRALRDAEAAWEFLSSGGVRGVLPPRLLFLDAGLPGDGALRLLNRLREDPRTAGVPVVMLVGSQAEAESILGRTGNSVGVIVRSVDYDAFLQAVTSTAGYWTKRLAAEACGPEALDVLLVEDSLHDAGMIEAELRRAMVPCRVHHVSDRTGLAARLKGEAPGLVLADYNVPTTDGPQTLALVRGRWPRVPFIVVSGDMAPDLATEMLRNGATDYVLKTRIGRLGAVVYRALVEAAEQARAAATEEALRQSQEQLRQAQKLEAVGRLASGIAHDINNILVTTSGCSELMLMRMGPDDPSRRDATSILQASRRAADLTRQLLAFGRKQPLAPRLVDLNGVVSGMEDMARRIVGEDIQLHVSRGAARPSVVADPGQLGQVILNLVVNARDAMPRGGRLEVRTADAERGGRPHVMLSVTDTGHGMEAETIAHIFDPFFTTKEVGKGSGLGLSVVYGIVQQSGGSIEVRSEPGRGSTFEVYLPHSEGPAAAPKEATVKESPRGSETILLVEDDAPVRELTARLLQMAGFRVLQAPNGVEALRTVENSPQPIHLVLTDVVMPEMSGPELGARIAARAPKIPLLYLSGWSDGTSARHGIPAGSTFLQKPFATRDLLHKVREALAAAPAPASRDRGVEMAGRGV